MNLFGWWADILIIHSEWNGHDCSWLFTRFYSSRLVMNDKELISTFNSYTLIVWSCFRPFGMEMRFVSWKLTISWDIGFPFWNHYWTRFSKKILTSIKLLDLWSNFWNWNSIHQIALVLDWQTICPLHDDGAMWNAKLGRHFLQNLILVYTFASNWSFYKDYRLSLPFDWL